MAYSDEEFDEAFPLERSPRDTGWQIPLKRVYVSDSGKMLSGGIKGIPFTGKPGDPANHKEFMDTMDRVYWKLVAKLH
jgi:hypothetical protein